MKIKERIKANVGNYAESHPQKTKNIVVLVSIIIFVVSVWQIIKGIQIFI
jgi:hypothetical protein